MGFGDYIPGHQILRFGTINTTAPLSTSKRILEEYDKTLLTLMDDPGFIIGTERSMRNDGSVALRQD
ncbi:hypothetical protein CRE_21509 [Caenorhabditis remanei]|uniref:Uncharacterized protein n=1 Tax=Caenorhabditis remanei TaxID=31234 RepID=E3N8Y5_CAERE|nr:hypothetical protein CRE_21509 [Caenorhabditis remanei]